MRGVAIILIGVAIAISILCTSILSKILGIPTFLAIGGGLALGTFATIFIAKYVKDIF
jgi:hypothetical protein